MRGFRLAIVFWLGLVAFGANKMQRLNLKTGLWEVTTTINNRGHMPIPNEMLERLTPEQRARMEARMNAQPVDRTRTVTRRHCVTEKDMNRGSLFSRDSTQGCKEQIVSSTSSAAEIQMVCENEGIKGNGTVKIQVLSPESARGTSHITALGNGQTVTTDSSFTAKWIGASCGSAN